MTFSTLIIYMKKIGLNFERFASNGEPGSPLRNARDDVIISFWVQLSSATSRSTLSLALPSHVTSASHLWTQAGTKWRMGDVSVRQDMTRCDWQTQLCASVTSPISGGAMMDDADASFTHETATDSIFCSCLFLFTLYCKKSILDCGCRLSRLNALF